MIQLRYSTTEDVCNKPTRELVYLIVYVSSLVDLVHKLKVVLLLYYFDSWIHRE